MKRAAVLAIAILVLLITRLNTPSLSAAAPAAGTLSATAPTITWAGRRWTAPNPVSCFSAAGTDPLCDRFSLTIVPPAGKNFVVTIRVTAANATDQTPPTDDIDLFVRDPGGNTVATSGTSGGIEELVLNNPPAGTYTVVVQPFLIVPGGTYSGFAAIGDGPRPGSFNSYKGVQYGANFVGTPSSTPSSSAPLVPELKTSFNYVGRQAAEPTVGVNRNNKAFFAASTFDFPSSTFPARLARTLVMRSTDKGATWQAVSPPLTAGLADDEENATFPPTSLDPYVYVDPIGLNQPAGRVFSVDLDAACGANAIFSDDEGAQWTTVPLFACNSAVNDHQTIVTAPPPAGLLTAGYPSVLYFCYNQVADSGCSRSLNGGVTFTPTAPAFTGSDPSAGSVCGGLTGHLVGDRYGRIFLPKGHCGLPWVAISSDAGNTWTRVKITNNTPMADHEVTLAVDRADNVYAVWQDGTFRLPFLSVSKDHGATWSTPIMMAPPGVHEVNFPTIAAGDAGRIVVLFPGSTSQNFSDATRPWNIYVVVSVNALDASPTFIWTTANDPKDPVHRGDCGPGRCDAQDGGSMFDFLNIVVSPADGAFWGTASDTCTPNADAANNCVTNPSAPKLRPGQGIAIRQIKGPALIVDR
ncbi:MAG: hypothetical protein DMF84_06480 [Acidobacteria bacterium]|nr:MAG: hypothetical protein DMF84_06480 [Acidobacteriota bacterium]